MNPNRHAHAALMDDTVPVTKAEKALRHAEKRPAVLSKFSTIQRAPANTRYEANGTYSAFTAATADWQDARRDEDVLHRDAHEGGRIVPPKAAERAKNKVAELAANRERIGQELRDKNRQAADEDLTAKAVVDALLTAGDSIKETAPVALKGDLLKVLAGAQADAAEEDRLDKIEQDALEPKSARLAKLKAQLIAQKGDGPLFKVSRRGALVPKVTKVPDVMPRGDTMPVMFDGLAAYLRDPRNFQAAEREIEVQVDEMYRDVTLTLTADEKKSAHAKRQARILAANRIEAAAVWALKNAGHRLQFRPELSPYAVLCIELPPFMRR